MSSNSHPCRTYMTVKQTDIPAPPSSETARNLVKRADTVVDTAPLWVLLGDFRRSTHYRCSQQMSV